MQVGRVDGSRSDTRRKQYLTLKKKIGKTERGCSLKRNLLNDHRHHPLLWELWLQLNKC
jgi:hypothetical protein